MHISITPILPHSLTVCFRKAGLKLPVSCCCNSSVHCSTCPQQNVDDDYCACRPRQCRVKAVRGGVWGIHILGAPYFFWTGAPLGVNPAGLLSFFLASFHSHTSAFISRIFVEIGMLWLFHIFCSDAPIACPLFNLVRNSVIPSSVIRDPRYGIFSTLRFYQWYLCCNNLLRSHWEPSVKVCLRHHMNLVRRYFAGTK